MRKWLPRALLVIACSCTSATSSTRCQNMCAREDECGKEVDVDFDRAECVAQCSALERDRHGRALVETHQGCLGQAATCAEVLACTDRVTGDSVRGTDRH